MGKGIYRTKWRRGFFLKFNFEVIRPMCSGSRGMGFTEDVCKFIIVCWDTSHVNGSIVGGSLVREEELVDLSIIHLGEMGEGCCIDKGNF